jgi:hypothetical protein
MAPGSSDADLRPNDPIYLRLSAHGVALFGEIDDQGFPYCYVLFVSRKCERVKFSPARFVGHASLIEILASRARECIILAPRRRLSSQTDVGRCR